MCILNIVCIFVDTKTINDMKATIKTKNPYTFTTYTVMIGKEVIKGFYSKKEAIEFRNNLNKQS